MRAHTPATLEPFGCPQKYGAFLLCQVERVSMPFQKTKHTCVFFQVDKVIQHLAWFGNTTGKCHCCIIKKKMLPPHAWLKVPAAHSWYIPPLNFQHGEMSLVV